MIAGEHLLVKKLKMFGILSKKESFLWASQAIAWQAHHTVTVRHTRTWCTYDTFFLNKFNNYQIFIFRHQQGRINEV